MCMYTYVYTCVGDHRGQKIVSDSLKLELQEAACHLAESLTIQLRSVARQQVYSTLNCLSSLKNTLRYRQKQDPS